MIYLPRLAKNMATRLFRKALLVSNTKHIVYSRHQGSERHLTRFSSSLSQSRNFENLLSETEKVVGYPTSLLRCLLSDEISSVLVHSKTLLGSRHPLVKTAKCLVYDGNEGFEAIGLVVLLMSRAGEPLIGKCPLLDQDPISGIQRDQRKLAEVAEMIKTGNKV